MMEQLKNRAVNGPATARAVSAQSRFSSSIIPEETRLADAADLFPEEVSGVQGTYRQLVRS